MRPGLRVTHVQHKLADHNVPQQYRRDAAQAPPSLCASHSKSHMLHARVRKWATQDLDNAQVCIVNRVKDTLKTCFLVLAWSSLPTYMPCDRALRCYRSIHGAASPAVAAETCSTNAGVANWLTATTSSCTCCVRLSRYSTLHSESANCTPAGQWADTMFTNRLLLLLPGQLSISTSGTCKGILYNVL